MVVSMPSTMGSPWLRSKHERHAALCGWGRTHAPATAHWAAQGVARVRMVVCAKGSLPRVCMRCFPRPGWRRTLSETEGGSEGAGSEAELAVRHAALLAAAEACLGGGGSESGGRRPVGLAERQDSANYQPRPPAMTERQDSARNLQVWEKYPRQTLDTPSTQHNPASVGWPRASPETHQPSDKSSAKAQTMLPQMGQQGAAVQLPSHSPDARRVALLRCQQGQHSAGRPAHRWTLPLVHLWRKGQSFPVAHSRVSGSPAAGSTTHTSNVQAP